MTVTLKMIAFWDTVLCSFVEVDRRLGGASCLHQHGTISQKTYHLHTAAVRTRNLTQSRWFFQVGGNEYPRFGLALNGIWY
jgi:hypothetical protein